MVTLTKTLSLVIVATPVQIRMTPLGLIVSVFELRKANLNMLNWAPEAMQSGVCFDIVGLAPIGLLHDMQMILELMPLTAKDCDPG